MPPLKVLFQCSWAHESALILFDFWLTLPHEVECIWRRKFTGASFLYLLLRYTTLSYQLLSCFEAFSPTLTLEVSLPRVYLESKLKLPIPECRTASIISLVQGIQLDIVYLAISGEYLHQLPSGTMCNWFPFVTRFRFSDLSHICHFCQRLEDYFGYHSFGTINACCWWGEPLKYTWFS